MTRDAEPPRRASAVVTDLDEARRKREAPSAERGAKAEAAEAGPPKPARRRRDPANRRFDAVKVERLRREIAEGRYEIDPFSVADRFIEHERNRG